MKRLVASTALVVAVIVLTVFVEVDRTPQTVVSTPSSAAAAWLSPWDSPSDMVADGPMVWVVNQMPGLIEFDTSTRRVVKVISEVHSQSFSTSSVVIAGKDVWVTGSAGSTTGLAEFDASSGQLVRFIRSTTLDQQYPGSLVLAGGAVWVLDNNGNLGVPSTLTQVNELTGRVIRRWTRLMCDYYGTQSLATNGRVVWGPACVGGVVAIAVSSGRVRGDFFKRVTPTDGLGGGYGVMSLLFAAGHLWITTPGGDIIEGSGTDGRVTRSWAIGYGGRFVSAFDSGYMARVGTQIFVIRTPENGPTDQVSTITISTGQVSDLSRWFNENQQGPECAIEIGAATWVCGSARGDTGGGWLAEVNLAEHRVIRLIDDPAYDIGEPGHEGGFQIDDSRDVWVSNALGGLTEFDGTSGRIVRNLDGPAYGFDSPSEMAVFDGRLWVSDGGRGSRMTIVDAATGRVVARWSAPHESLAAGWALASSGPDVWIATGHSVVEVDATTLQVVRTVSDAQGPYDFSTPWDAVVAGGALWVFNDPGSGSGTVTVISVRTGRLIRVVTLPPWGGPGYSPGAILAAEGQIWVSNADGGYVILSERTGKPIGHVHKLPDGAVGASDMVRVGNDIWFGTINGPPVVAVNITSLRPISLSSQFDFITTTENIDVVGHDLWVLGYGAADMEIDLRDDSLVQVLTNGFQPFIAQHE